MKKVLSFMGFVVVLSAILNWLETRPSRSLLTDMMIVRVTRRLQDDDAAGVFGEKWQQERNKLFELAQGAGAEDGARNALGELCFLMAQKNSADNVIQVVERDDGHHRMIDGWGREINLLKAEAPEVVESLRLQKNVISNFVIWSSGRNGINEFGGGDDILFRR